jgi:hypothetical protein
MALAPALRKTSRKHGRRRKSFLFGTQTSAQELALAKPMKCSSKFVAKSSWLTIGKKVTTTTVKIVSKKACSTSTGGSGVTRASTRVLELFGLGSSASGDEPPPPRELPHKHPRKFPPLRKGVPQPSMMKGNFE